MKLRPTRYRANSTRMGSQFDARMEQGTMIDRYEQQVRGTRKNPKHVGIPNALAKFFKPVGQEEA